jgi:hypothetical protein
MHTYPIRQGIVSSPREETWFPFCKEPGAARQEKRRATRTAPKTGRPDWSRSTLRQHGQSGLCQDAATSSSALTSTAAVPAGGRGTMLPRAGCPATSRRQALPFPMRCTEIV